jgi:hypothetical protein
MEEMDASRIDTDILFNAFFGDVPK